MTITQFKIVEKGIFEYSYEAVCAVYAENDELCFNHTISVIIEHYDNIGWRIERIDPVQKIKYSSNHIMCVNDNGLWECDDLGVCILPERILKDRITGNYCMYEVESGYAKNIDDVVNMIYAKNGKWTSYKYFLDKFFLHNNDEEYKNRITLFLKKKPEKSLL